MNSRISLISRVLVLCVTVAVLLTVAHTPAPPAVARVAENEVRPIFDQLVKDEPQHRAAALDDWAHHRWSQLDGFGAMEREQFSAIARERQVSPQALFRVLDDGLRAGWPGPTGQPLDSRTVPLKPRPMD